MEVDEIQRQAFKFQRISSSNGHDGNNLGHPDEEKDRVVLKRSSGGGSGGGGGVGNGMDILGGGGGRLCGWPSSRIVRVSRASGGKDRHSKVLTSKGLRDRRVRLSVTTAIQFYDLQDRLGYDQPSKAVEWLIKAASSSIAELPSLNQAFCDASKQLSNEKSDVELDGDLNFQLQQQGQNVKSACSSTSETSKGSGLSLSRSESRIKARERARERAAEKEKEKENDSHCPISQNSSFTELLNAGINNNHHNTKNISPNGLSHQNSGGSRGGGGDGSESDLLKSRRQSQWMNPLDYPFTPPSSRGGETSFLRHMNSLPQFNTTGDNHHHHEPQQFSFVPENFVPVATTAGERYNLNFSMSSSGLAGFNRGTLQSNSSQSPLLSPHLQRFDGSNINLPFFNGSSTASASNAAASPAENHHQFPAGFNARLQLCYGETPPSGRHSDDHRGKGKH